MSKIHHHQSHHHSSDQLDLIALKDGEKLNVVWPDGSSEVISTKVIVRKCEHNVSQEAYFVSKYHGRDAWSRLLGVEAGRVS